MATDDVIDAEVWGRIIRDDFGGCGQCADGIAHSPDSKCSGRTIDRPAVERDEDAGVKGDPDDEVIYDVNGKGWHVRSEATCKCEHPQSRHEANECWTDRDTGEETWGSSEIRMCQCDWYEPAGVSGPWDKWRGHVQS